VHGCETKIISGTPDPKHVSTSYVERQNFTIRLSMRRFTRLTNGFSKKLKTTRQWWPYTSCITTRPSASDAPGDAGNGAGIADRVWSIEEVVGLLN